MANKMQIKRGLKANLPTLGDGEFGLCTDTNELYIGNASVNKQISTLTGTETLTNKSITQRVGTITSGTPAPNADTQDVYTVTALATGVTVSAPTGTPTEYQSLMLRFKDNGTARSIGWNAIYRAIGVTLPTTTVVGKTLYVGCRYNSADSKWDVLAVGQEA